MGAERAAGGEGFVTQGAMVPVSVDVRSGDAVLQVKVVGDGPAVVLVPGLARGASDYAGLMQGLAGAGYRAVAINLRGAEGSSGPFKRMTLETIERDIGCVARALALGRFDLLGHALGAYVARFYASRHPEMVRSVICLAGGGRAVVQGRVAPFLAAVERAIAGEIGADEMDRAMVACGLVAPTSDPREFRTGWWPNLHALLEAWKAVPPESYMAAGGRPMLVMYGALDGIAPPPNMLSLREDLGAQVTLVEIAGAGHCVQAEQPAAVEAALLDWLRRQAAG